VTALRDDALALLRDWHTSDPGQEALRRVYVEHLDVHPDGADRTCVPHHLTAGALILSADHTRVLLTLHGKARRWFHTGGHCEPQDTTLAVAALREATEESGVQGLAIDPEPIQLDAHWVAFCGSSERVQHLDVRFLALAPADAEPVVSEESLDVRWWPVDELPTDDEDMLTMTRLALQRASQASSAS
jgi:8-oxo-dGTP pyrophosphatase MutT (NUDIX family)